MTDLPSPFLTPSPPWFYAPADNGAIRLISRWEVEPLIVAEAMRDADFRKFLTEDPKSAIEQLMEATLPANLEIEIITEQPGKLAFILPSKPTGKWTEVAMLSDAVLPYIAWGRGLEQRTLGLDEKTYVALVTRAWADECFRDQLLAEPKYMIESLHGACFKPDTEVIALGETGDQVFILLPPSEAAEEELIPGVGTVNLNPIFVQVLQSGEPMTVTIPTVCVMACPQSDPPTKKQAGCPWASCTCFATLGQWW